MITLKQFREQTKHLSGDTQIWLSIDEEGNAFHGVIEIQECTMQINPEPGSKNKPAILLWPDEGYSAWGPA